MSRLSARRRRSWGARPGGSLRGRDSGEACLHASPGADTGRNVAAGLSTGILCAILAMTHGVMAFAPLGPEAVSIGIAAAIVAAALAGLAMALLSDTRPIIGTTTASTAVLLASMFSAAQPSSIESAFLLAQLVTALAGVLILLVAWAGLGRLAGLMPTPVAIGLTNAVVVLILLGQLPLALGQRPGETFSMAALQPGAALVAIVTVALMLKPLPRLPAPVVAFGIGCALHYLLAAGGVAVGPVLGVSTSPGLVISGLVAAQSQWTELQLDGTLALLLTSAALSLVLLALVETISAGAAVRERTGRRSNTSRDLFGAGAAMLGGAAAGGIPGSTMVSATMACLAWGGRSQLALLMHAATTLLAFFLLTPLAASLPYPVLAGVLLGAQLQIFQWRPLLPVAGLGRTRRAADTAIVLAVVASAVAFGLVVAVATGVLVSVIIFTASMARSPVRRSIRNPTGRSRVRRPARVDQLLHVAGDRIRLIELEGAIFFGSAEAVLTEIERAKAEGCEVLILDLGRVTRIDQSGGRRLLEACAAMPGRVLLAPLHAGSRAAMELEALGLFERIPRGAAMPTLADAVEAAEEMLLAELEPAGPRYCDARDALRALALPEQVIATLAPRLAEQTFPAGSVIARRGDDADAAYLLLEGQVLISLPPGPGRPATRLAVLAPGVIFGESALLGDARRTADVTARETIRCLRIDRDMVKALRREAPDVAWHLMAAVARQLNGHVTAANVAIDRLEG
jgi:sulfate permease, SulP family